MSTHKDIVDAVKTLVDAVSGGVTSVIRDRAVKLEEDTLPLVVIVKGREFPATRYAMGGGAYRAYEVFVYALCAQNQQVQTGIDDGSALRATIRKRLIPDGTAVPPLLTGVAAVWDVNEVEAPDQRPAAAEAGYEEAKLGLRYETIEDQHA
jgi:hypothetical protein